MRFALRILIVFVLCAAPAAELFAAEPAKIVRIGLPTGVDPVGKALSAQLTAIQEPLLDEELAVDGAKVQWVNVAGAGPGLNEAIAAGLVDFVFYGDFPAIIGRSGGLKVKLIVPGQRGANSYLLVPPDSPAKSIADLKGQRLAIHKGRPWELAFSRLLAANGLTQGDFQIFNLNPLDGAAALAGHSVDALYSIDGFALEERGLGKIIWSTRSQPLDWKYTAELYVTEDFANRNPAITEHVAKAYVRSAYYMSLPEHREETLRRSVSAASSYDVVMKDAEGVDMKDRWDPVIDPFIRAHYREAIQYAVDSKLIRKPFSADDLIDSHFVDAALKELKLENYWAPLGPDGKPTQTAKAE